jgi:hypothetical protein
VITTAFMTITAIMNRSLHNQRLSMLPVVSLPEGGPRASRPGPAAPG